MYNHHPIDNVKFFQLEYFGGALKNPHLYAVIIAGGKGKRFWPLSRDKRPKQLLSLTGSHTLLEDTVERVKPLLADDKIFVVTGRNHADKVRESLPDIPKENIIVEPIGKNTAPAIAVATAHIMAQDKDGVMVVLPADHVVGLEKRFVENILDASKVAESKSLLVTFGIHPRHPEIGYGYIEVGKNIVGSAYRVKAFKEKPTRKKAKFYVDTGRYLWNSGMFVFRADVFMEKVKEHMPQLHSVWETYSASKKGKKDLTAFYESAPPVSIDYGIMEKSVGATAVIPATFSWSDIGSWQALDEIWEDDEQGNRKSNNCKLVSVKSENNTVLSRKLVALLGVEGLVVVETDDALLISKKDRSQEIKPLVDEIERLGYTEYL